MRFIERSKQQRSLCAHVGLCSCRTKLMFLLFTIYPAFCGMLENLPHDVVFNSCADWLCWEQLFFLFLFLPHVSVDNTSSSGPDVSVLHCWSSFVETSCINIICYINNTWESSNLVLQGDADKSLLIYNRVVASRSSMWNNSTPTLVWFILNNSLMPWSYFSDCGWQCMFTSSRASGVC